MKDAQINLIELPPEALKTGPGRGRAADRKPVIDIQNVRKSFGGNQVLKDVSLQVHDQEVVCLIGSSGSGKSTLLRCINQLEFIDSGRISFRDELVGTVERAGVLHEASPALTMRQRRKIGMVFQNFNLFGHMTALQNVAAGPRLALGTPKAEAHQAALALLSMLGLAEKTNLYPSQLSGGQQQRVAIARALAMKPDVLLMDEPTSALDPELVQEVLDAIRMLAANGMTMVIVTHEMGLVRDIADRVTFMHQGVIAEQGSVDEIFGAPKTIALRNFVGGRRH
ncbi:polar amino acid transport system ATP-binding protein [Neorhizobium galegae]|uniref:amino acid ABC transporter ATP-binding protein n=1 Tax=Neorhizobium galegae TaxID=399 RepID=UPI0027862898|nr:amino acid ABC transporter ATP-binding protein [Neorhizobium galegae]MDQ0137715.1 polar amino acid transport system ATP-binding protein [Neorhizobium galegae]